MVSKKSRAKALYNCKLTVTDVQDAFHFAALTEDGQTVDHLKERDLETVLPKVGAKGMVLKGKSKGEIGVLFEKVGRRDHCLLQMDDGNILKIPLDDCAAFVVS